jgi:hypothetical protein
MIPLELVASTASSDSSTIYAFIGLDILMFMIMIPLILWIKLGGYPEGTYRIFRIQYFSAIFIDAGGTPRRFPLRMSKLQTGDPQLPAFFEFHGFSNSIGRYYTNPQQTTRHNGRDSWYYYPDNPFPIPIRNLATGTNLSAVQLNKAWKDDTMEQFLHIGKPKVTKSRTKWLYLGLGVLVIFMLIGLLAFTLR